MVLGIKVAIFNWEWGRNSTPSDGQKIPCYDMLQDYLPLNYMANSFIILICIHNYNKFYEKNLWLCFYHTGFQASRMMGFKGYCYFRN